MAITSREFEATFESDCPECGDRIEEGDIVAFDNRHPDDALCPECLDKARNSLGFGA